MIKLLLSITPLLLSVAACFGQDTLKVEPSRFYSSVNEPFQGKDFAFRVQRSREDIVFSDSHQRIEYCYYYDTRRICFGTTYRITSDSTLDMDGEVWRYTQRGRRYFLERYFNGTYVFGYSRSIIPFEPEGLFTTTTADKMDTLWTTDYKNYNPSSPFYHPLYKFHKTPVQGKVYALEEVDEAPRLRNGEAMVQTLYLSPTRGCYSEPYSSVREIQCVITAEGRVVNMQKGFGNQDLDYCPYDLLDLIRYVLQLGEVEPAKIKGQKVPVQWTFRVERRVKSGRD